MNINALIEEIISREGGYVNHPNDRGGPTMWGITEKVARDNGYKGAIKDMHPDTARDIYKRLYIVKPGFDRIAEIPLAEPIAAEMADTGVNMGTSVPGPMLQKALNLLNNQGKDYADLKVDGQCGPATRSALAAYLGKRGKDGVTVLLRLLNAQQAVRYMTIAEGRPANEAFMHGWIMNRVVI